LAAFAVLELHINPDQVLAEPAQTITLLSARSYLKECYSLSPGINWLLKPDAIINRT
jgi:hypothetical protein